MQRVDMGKIFDVAMSLANLQITMALASEAECLLVIAKANEEVDSWTASLSPPAASSDRK